MFDDYFFEPNFVLWAIPGYAEFVKQICEAEMEHRNIIRTMAIAFYDVVEFDNFDPNNTFETEH